MSHPALSHSLIGKPHPPTGESKGDRPLASTGAPQPTPNPGAPSGGHSIKQTDARLAPKSVGEAARAAPLGAPALPDNAQGGAAALPCLKNNNSTKPEFYRVENDSLENDCKSDEDSPVKCLKADTNGRQLLELEGIQFWVGGLSPAEIKKSFALVENLKHMVDLFGLEHIGFLTLTFKDNVTDFKEAQRRFNSLATHVLRKLFEHYIAVVEPQQRGAVHYHMAVVCLMDIRTGFDFSAFYACQREFKQQRRSKRFLELRRRYSNSASSYLKGLWRHLHKVMGKYRFGRSELLPIRTNAEGIAHYVGKYLEKGCMYRGDQFKGARMVRYSRGWKNVSQSIAWRKSGAKWRKKIGEVAAILGAEDLDDLQEKAGRYWAFKALSILKAYPDATAEEIARILKAPFPYIFSQ